MSWVKIDDAFPEHPKVVPLSDRAFRIHVRALCYCARNLTDGRVPRGAEQLLGCTLAQIGELVTAGLWDVRPDGWAVHDYLQYNPSREQVMVERGAAKARLDRWRNGRSNGVSNGVSSPSPVPVPVRTTTLSKESSVVRGHSPREKRPQLIDDDFRQRMVAAYPHQPRAQVLEAIDDAMAHKSYDKWKDKERYVMSWLRRQWPKGEEHENAKGRATSDSPYTWDAFAKRAAENTDE